MRYAFLVGMLVCLIATAKAQAQQKEIFAPELACDNALKSLHLGIGSPSSRSDLAIIPDVRAGKKGLYVFTKTTPYFCEVPKSDLPLDPRTEGKKFDKLSDDVACANIKTRMPNPSGCDLTHSHTVQQVTCNGGHVMYCLVCKEGTLPVTYNGMIIDCRSKNFAGHDLNLSLLGDPKESIYVNYSEPLVQKESYQISEIPKDRQKAFHVENFKKTNCSPVLDLGATDTKPILTNYLTKNLSELDKWKSDQLHFNLSDKLDDKVYAKAVNTCANVSGLNDTVVKNLKQSLKPSGEAIDQSNKQAQ